MTKKIKFISYLEYTYFGKMEDKKYIKTIFYIQEWSIFNRILKFEPRTTNGSEAWHRSIYDKIKISNPKIALFIKNLLECEKLSQIEFKQNLKSNITWSRKDTKKINEAILF
ncbi:hypothetical protein DMUE_4393 [Dictyocoela muelleri]|nr:hypothetical protein DMUE_4393 [Dictyocoela muelleri]